VHNSPLTTTKKQEQYKNQNKETNGVRKFKKVRAEQLKQQEAQKEIKDFL
jgi:hypothetical protein